MNQATRVIDPDKIHVGDIVLVATGTWITQYVQRRLGLGDRSKWTHVAGSLGGYDLIEGQVPRSRVADLQKDYVAKGFEIKVMRKRQWNCDNDRVKVALWWATLNNLRYNFFGLMWFGLACFMGKGLLLLRNEFNNMGKEFCSELLADGFYKQNYYLFGRPAADVLPANYDDSSLFEEVVSIWGVNNLSNRPLATLTNPDD